MSTANSRLAQVRIAERRGGDRPTEDRIFIASNAVIVLDGASQPDQPERNGGWLAEQVGSRLHRGLLDSPRVDLSDLLGIAIREVAADFGLVPGAAPSTTVSIVRWNAECIDALVLGDSPVIAITRTWRPIQVRDDRLSRVASAERQALRRANGSNVDRARVQAWTALVEAQRRSRNQPGGYWIAEASPEAAQHSIRATWRRHELVHVLVMTDGVANGVDRYGLLPDWAAACRIAVSNPAALVDLVHEAEEGDANGTRWPRSKTHDDKAIAVISFAQ
jgi:hypothetical protein